MRNRSAALMISLCMLLYLGLTVCGQWAWEASCPYATAGATPVYTPGTQDDIAAMLPAGTPCRAEATVGDSWQSIEYRLNGETCMGMVRAGSLIAQSEP